MEYEKILVTGSSGLIGSEMVSYFKDRTNLVIGIDNNQRQEFFGQDGDTTDVLERIQGFPNFRHENMDIRDREGIMKLVEKEKPSAIIHCAAQPSHDLAAKIPFIDFDVNTGGTLNLLEATRRHCPESPFVYFSTNKVYGDAPNHLELEELPTRYDFKKKEDQGGIREDLSIDQCVHSLFGVNKAAADLMVQEYGRNFGLYTACLRGGCLTGPNHRGAQLHGFLSYLVKCCVKEIPYTIFGYKGKQVRDNIHSLDVARFVDAFLEKPRKGEVYNLGGGKENALSLIEAVRLIEELSLKEMKMSYEEQNRVGDHICYYSDLSHIKEHYPEWKIRIPLRQIFEEIHHSWV